MNHDRSRNLYDRALSVLPGGVNSPVRATRPYPFFVQRGDGGHIIDVDGNRFIDYVMGYGPLLLGHTLPDAVIAEIQSQLTAGPMYGAPTEVEIELAEFVARHVSSVEMVRFVNSGTEATASAVRLARGYTDRDRLVVVKGGYHGAQESTLVSGSVGRPAAPSSPGVPASMAAQTIPVIFNDVDSVSAVFDSYGEEIAALLVEPLLGNTGCISATAGYLDELRQLTDEYGTVLIFDEVMTGFRIGGLACAQGKYAVTPDLTTFGKVIGGGFPVGAVGGPTHIMEHLTPAGDVFQAGTYSGHAVAMVAGLETLRYAAKHDVYDHLEGLGELLRGGLTDIVEESTPSYTVTGIDSMFKVIFSRGNASGSDGRCAAGCRQRPDCPHFEICPKDKLDVKNAETDRWERLFWHDMKNHGVFLTANQMESQFLCNAHTREDIESTLEAYKEAL